MIKAPKSDALKKRRVFGNSVHRDNLLSGCCRTTAIEEYALMWCRGKGVDYGYGDSESYPSKKNIEYILDGAVGIDLGVVKYGEKCFSKRLLTVKDETINAVCFPKELNNLDFIFSSHCLEHIENWQDVLIYWRSRIKNTGILFLYLPHESVAGWRSENIDSHVWTPRVETLNPFLCKIGFELIEYMVGCDSEGSFYIICRKTK